jgi:hypothetical protein
MTTSKKTSKPSPGSFGAHGPLLCEHCGTTYWHGNVCGCAASKGTTAEAIKADLKAKGFATLAF